MMEDGDQDINTLQNINGAFNLSNQSSGLNKASLKD